MEHVHHTFDAVETLPTLNEIEKQLRKLGCTKEQVRRHVDQMTVSRSQDAKESRPRRPRYNHHLDWLSSHRL
jgi:hypothetical protein